jgi:hypothetical protein
MPRVCEEGSRKLPKSFLRSMLLHSNRIVAKLVWGSRVNGMNNNTGKSYCSIDATVALNKVTTD